MDIFYENRDGLVRFFHAKNLNFSSHFHKQLEIVYLPKGHCDVVIDTKIYNFNEGDFLIIFPNQIHSYQNSIEENGHYILFFSPEFINEFYQIFIHKTPNNPIIHASHDMINIFMNAYKDFDLNINEINKGYILILLSKIFEKTDFWESDNSTGDTVHLILQYCADNFNNNITLENIAKVFNLNPNYASHIFSQKLNISFRDYINSLRIDFACNLLTSTNKSITDISFESGFESLRTFNRAFVKFKNLSPHKYRKSYLL